MQPTEWIWRDGDYVRWNDATTHVTAHALHYGSAVFEGARAYETPDGPRFFRLRDHLRRLGDSAKLYGMPLRHGVDALFAACSGVLQRNGLRHAYLRPLVFRGPGELKIEPRDNPVETIVCAWQWGRYFADPDRAIDVGVSSWRRVAPSTMPALAKAAGNYLSSLLIQQEARQNGFAEGIALTTDGLVGEGAGSNVFCVHRGRLYTPDVASSILVGITRDTVMTLARDLGLEVIEERMPRERLLLADEVFLCGTAAEITAVGSVDRAPVGRGAPGPVTRRLQQAFAGLFDGSHGDRHGWLEVPAP
ncbi:MAG: branched-chain amino acid transaminase [Planctomycetota bacterium]